MNGRIGLGSDSDSDQSEVPRPGFTEWEQSFQDMASANFAGSLKVPLVACSRGSRNSIRLSDCEKSEEIDFNMNVKLVGIQMDVEPAEARDSLEPFVKFVFPNRNPSGSSRVFYKGPFLEIAEAKDCLQKLSSF